MAPCAAVSVPSLTVLCADQDDLTMITAMDSESTDGESSLLSSSGPDAPSTSSLQSVSRHPRSNMAPPCLRSPLASPSSSLPTSPDGKKYGEVPLELPTNSEHDQGFFFETDHVSLKGNADYQVLLRSVILLESQRQKAIQDLDKLEKCKQQALDDPIGFVDKLQNRVDLDLPQSQDVAEIPSIDWDSYMANVDPLQFKQPKHMTRHTFRKQTDDAIFKSLELSGTSNSHKSTSAPPPNIGKHLNKRTAAETSSTSADSRMVTSVPTTTNGYTGAESDTEGQNVVRGRVKLGGLGSRSTTFNQLWTVDEQRRLEQLLVKYPPEEVEMKRWGKIAAELGNRTTLQVASRVQKYFIKLARAGLPVPGRLPGGHNYSKRYHRHQRTNRFMWSRSTFLASYEPPVYMTDEGEDSGSYAESYTGSAGDLADTEVREVSDDESVPAELRDTDEYRELLHLKRLRRQKIAEISSRVRHVGYKCDRCECEPIVGVRWHCVTCPSETSVDFCDNCADFVFETKTHKSSHQLEVVREAETVTAPHMDRDYTRFLGSDYNYLDPNYMPAS